MRRLFLALAPLALTTAGCAQPAAPPVPPGLEALGNPFVGPAGYDSEDQARTKHVVNGLGVVGGRVYLSHGSTDSPVSNRLIYYDLAAGAWRREADAAGRPLDPDQEGFSRARVGPSGRLYFNSHDPRDRHQHVLIRRERSGRWTLRPIGPEGKSNDVYEFVDGRDTVVVAHAGRASIGAPSVLLSENGGRSFRIVGRRVPEGQSAPDGLPLGTFFTFRGRVYLGNMGRLQPGDAWPFLLRYVPAADRAAPDSVFEVVARTHPEVVPAGETTNVLDEAEEVGAGDSTRLVWRGGCALYTTLDLTAARTRRVALPAGTCASEIARVGDSLYVLARPARPDATTSVLLVTADGRTFAERFRADGPWLLSLAWARDPGAPPGQGAFYFGSLGLPPAPSLYRLRYPLARPPARDGW